MIGRIASIAVFLVGTLPSYAFAQQADRIYRVVLSMPSPASALAGAVPSSEAVRIFIEELKARGYVEGRNLILDRRSRYGLDPQAVANQLADIVRSKPDVIALDSTPLAVMAQKLTTTIPIVLVASIDPVGAGLAHSLARPGKNVTGLVSDVGAGSEEKRMDLFLEMLPKARRLAYIGVKGDWETLWAKAAQSVALKRGRDLFFAAGSPPGFTEALDALKQERPEAFVVALGPRTTASVARFVEFALANGIPSSCGIAEMADSGCLMAYGQSYKNFFAYSVRYVDKILKGAFPGDLPIEQPTKFELVVNMRTAKALGIAIPPAVLTRADRVID
jgi:putative ABC transport system substrate-binding protein